jgi:hypothetical protein
VDGGLSRVRLPFMDEPEPQEIVYRLQRRTQQGQIDYLINQHALLLVRVQVLERRVAELQGVTHVTEESRDDRFGS